MIPNHAQFLEAITAKTKVRVRFYSKADSGVVDRVCAPLDYGPEAEPTDELNRYWLWDYANISGSAWLGLLPGQVLEMHVLGEVFDPAQLGIAARSWSVPRDWGNAQLSDGSLPQAAVPSKG